MKLAYADAEFRRAASTAKAEARGQERSEQATTSRGLLRFLTPAAMDAAHRCDAPEADGQPRLAKSWWRFWC